MEWLSAVGLPAVVLGSLAITALSAKRQAAENNVIITESRDLSDHDVKGQVHVDTDSDGWLSAPMGCMVDRRYEIDDCIGQGVAGRIFLAYDHKTRSDVALKSGRRKPKGQKDYGLLGEHHWLRVMDKYQRKEAAHHIVHLRDPGLVQTNGHQCLVLELLGPTLHTYLHSEPHEPIIDRAALDVCQALKFIHSHNNVFIDLKTDNIGLCIDPNHASHWVLMDGGAASTDQEILGECNCAYRGIKMDDPIMSAQELETHLIPLSSRVKQRINGFQCLHLRAPEIILGMVLDRQMDMWSFGLLLATILSRGHQLFGPITPTTSWCEYDQLAAIVRLCGAPSEAMWARIPFQWRVKFFHFWNRHIPRSNTDEDPIDVEHVNQKGRLEIQQALCDWFQSLKVVMPSHNQIDLIARCLRIDPKDRITASQACCHPALKEIEERLARQRTKRPHTTMIRSQSDIASRRDSGVPSENST
eukprot:Ihof_evm1s181 gene=Ihof_evmTU1s181